MLPSFALRDSEYIRRFAVLPNWDSARWYVPLDRAVDQ